MTINCKSSFEGTYHFTYEVDESSGGICNSEHSHIKACQEPGSPYVDNQVFRMNFGECPGISEALGTDQVHNKSKLWHLYIN